MSRCCCALYGGLDSVARHFPELVGRWLKNDEAQAFAVPTRETVDERSPRRRAGAAMAFDTASASAGRGPSIAQVFGAEFAAHLGSIGTLAR